MKMNLIDLPKEIIAQIGTNLKIRDDWLALLSTCQKIKAGLLKYPSRPIIDIYYGKEKTLHWKGKYTRGQKICNDIQISFLIPEIKILLEKYLDSNTYLFIDSIKVKSINDFFSYRKLLMEENSIYYSLNLCILIKFSNKEIYDNVLQELQELQQVYLFS